MKKARKTAKPLVPVIDEHNDNRLWRLVTDHPNILDTLIVTKLNDNDVKFFYDVNSESRAAIKRAGAQLRNAFKIEDFDTKSTLSWALQKCARSKKKKLFCSRMARNGTRTSYCNPPLRPQPCMDDETSILHRGRMPAMHQRPRRLALQVDWAMDMPEHCWRRIDDA